MRTWHEEGERASLTPSYSLTLRCRLVNRPGTLATVVGVIGYLAGGMGAIDIVRAEPDYVIRDISIITGGVEHGERIAAAVRQLDDVELLQVSDRTFLMHLGGKLEITSKVPLKTRDDLSMAYTPGVARVCMHIHEDPSRAFNLTIKKNTVAVVSDGTAVLGLGDIGPEAAMPVMEGKAVLFKEFAGVDAFPICLDTTDVDEIVETVVHIAPGFGGINLEDISAPRCFEIENRLRERLDIPVFHDDQHGTAVVVLAALVNAAKVVGKDLHELSVTMAGAGAAGMAVAQILLDRGVKELIVCDRRGIIHSGRDDLNPFKAILADTTNRSGRSGSLADALVGADVFIGVSAPDTLTPDDIDRMADDPLIFALANPEPEISAKLVAKSKARVIATGRSDQPNQINNVLCFPGIFRGALDVRASEINKEMKIAAAQAIAEQVPENLLNEEYIVPSVFNPKVAESVAEAVREAARRTGVARRGGGYSEDEGSV